MCLRVESIEFDIADGVLGSERQGDLDIQLLIGIFSYSRILETDRLFPSGHDLILEVLVTRKSVYHVFAEGIFKAQLPRGPNLSSPQGVGGLSRHELGLTSVHLVAELRLIMLVSVGHDEDLSVSEVFADLVSLIPGHPKGSNIPISQQPFHL